MLVYQQNPDILPLLRVRLEGGLDGRRLGLGVHDHEVALGVGGVGDVLAMTTG
jgi:hypothetical protein